MRAFDLAELIAEVGATHKMVGRATIPIVAPLGSMGDGEAVLKSAR